MGSRFHARKRSAGVQLVAEDANFVVGSGERVAGALSDIVLARTGRTAGLDVLAGPVPAAAFGR